ncbi:hypothetical protein ACI77J_30115 [Pseudomonas sp. O64]|uniref:immunity protein Imm33 domain-containing protein n=1 Tax=unclassified Pseudomonas TaxID=196821 RepID=UPI00387AFB10
MAPKFVEKIAVRVRKEQSICEWQGVTPDRPQSGSKIGIALGTLGLQPINGLRVNPENGTNGWYLWCGMEWSEADDFFSSLHVGHITDYLPEVVEYLDLPPGYRFYIDGNNFEDVWLDPELVRT